MSLHIHLKGLHQLSQQLTDLNGPEPAKGSEAATHQAAEKVLDTSSSAPSPSLKNRVIKWVRPLLPSPLTQKWKKGREDREDALERYRETATHTLSQLKQELTQLDPKGEIKDVKTATQALENALEKLRAGPQGEFSGVDDKLRKVQNTLSECLTALPSFAEIEFQALQKQCRYDLLKSAMEEHRDFLKKLDIPSDDKKHMQGEMAWMKSLLKKTVAPKQWEGFLNGFHDLQLAHYKRAQTLIQKQAPASPQKPQRPLSQTPNSSHDQTLRSAQERLSQHTTQLEEQLKSVAAPSSRIRSFIEADLNSLQVLTQRGEKLKEGKIVRMKEWQERVDTFCEQSEKNLHLHLNWICQREQLQLNLNQEHTLLAEQVSQLQSSPPEALSDSDHKNLQRAQEGLASFQNPSNLDEKAWKTWMDKAHRLLKAPLASYMHQRERQALFASHHNQIHQFKEEVALFQQGLPPSSREQKKALEHISNKLEVIEEELSTEKTFQQLSADQVGNLGERIQSLYLLLSVCAQKASLDAAPPSQKLTPLTQDISGEAQAHLQTLETLMKATEGKYPAMHDRMATYYALLSERLTTLPQITQEKGEKAAIQHMDSILSHQYPLVSKEAQAFQFYHVEKQRLMDQLPGLIELQTLYSSPQLESLLSQLKKELDKSIDPGSVEQVTQWVELTQDLHVQCVGFLKINIEKALLELQERCSKMEGNLEEAKRREQPLHPRLARHLKKSLLTMQAALLEQHKLLQEIALGEGDLSNLIPPCSLMLHIQKGSLFETYQNILDTPSLHRPPLESAHELGTVYQTLIATFMQSTLNYAEHLSEEERKAFSALKAQSWAQNPSTSSWERPPASSKLLSTLELLASFERLVSLGISPTQDQEKQKAAAELLDTLSKMRPVFLALHQIRQVESAPLGEKLENMGRTLERCEPLAASFPGSLRSLKNYKDLLSETHKELNNPDLSPFIWLGKVRHHTLTAAELTRLSNEEESRLAQLRSDPQKNLFSLRESAREALQNLPDFCAHLPQQIAGIKNGIQALQNRIDQQLRSDAPSTPQQEAALAQIDADQDLLQQLEAVLASLKENPLPSTEPFQLEEIPSLMEQTFSHYQKLFELFPEKLSPSSFLSPLKGELSRIGSILSDLNTSPPHRIELARKKSIEQLEEQISLLKSKGATAQEYPSQIQATLLAKRACLDLEERYLTPLKKGEGELSWIEKGVLSQEWEKWEEKVTQAGLRKLSPSELHHAVQMLFQESLDFCLQTEIQLLQSAPTLSLKAEEHRKKLQDLQKEREQMALGSPTLPFVEKTLSLLKSGMELDPITRSPQAMERLSQHYTQLTWEHEHLSELYRNIHQSRELELSHLTQSAPQLLISQLKEKGLGSKIPLLQKHLEEALNGLEAANQELDLEDPSTLDKWMDHTEKMAQKLRAAIHDLEQLPQEQTSLSFMKDWFEILSG